MSKSDDVQEFASLVVATWARRTGERRDPLAAGEAEYEADRRTLSDRRNARKGG